MEHWNADIRKRLSLKEAYKYFNYILTFYFNTQSMCDTLEQMDELLERIVDRVDVVTNEETICDAIRAEGFVIDDESLETAMQRLHNPGRTMRRAYYEVISEDYSDIINGND